MDGLSKIEREMEYLPTLINSITNEGIRMQVGHQILTYANRASRYKKVYYILTFSSVILPALVVALNSFSEHQNSPLHIAITIISSISSIVAGILGITNVKELWISYRKGCEAAKNEIFIYVNGIGKYNTNDISARDSLFIEEMNILYDQQNKKWEAILNNNEKIK